MDDLSRDADEATNLLRGLTVRVVRRHRSSELLVEFENGTRLFVNSATDVELSITGGDA